MAASAPPGFAPSGHRPPGHRPSGHRPSGHLPPGHLSVRRGGPFHLTVKAMELLSHSNVPPSWVPRPGIEHGKGSFGRDVFADHPELKKEVAIETTGLTIKSSAPRCARFVHELNVLIAAQSHPCVIEFLDVVCASGGEVGLVLARCGPSLEVQIGGFKHLGQRKLSSKIGGFTLPWEIDRYSARDLNAWTR